MPKQSNVFGSVMIPGELVTYQPEAVVSRVVLKSACGSVTVFAFDQGQELSEHTVPFDAMVSLLEGEAEISISGSSHHLGGGEMIHLPANESHAVKALTPFKMVLTLLKT